MTFWLYGIAYRLSFYHLVFVINFIVHNEKKAIQEDFEESFAGLDDTKHENNSSSTLPLHQVVEETEIQTVDQREVESVEQNHESYLDSLGPDPGVNTAAALSFLDEVPNKTREEEVEMAYQQPVEKMKVLPVIERDYQRIIAENTFITSPPKQGRYVVST